MCDGRDPTMNDDNFGYREWLKDYIKKTLGKWIGEVDERIMSNQKEIKNWPTKIEVELPCECCGEKQKVPFIAKRFRAKENIEWPYYIEYMSPAMLQSICPTCKRPFRLNRKTPEQRM